VRARKTTVSIRTLPFCKVPPTKFTIKLGDLDPSLISFLKYISSSRQNIGSGQIGQKKNRIKKPILSQKKLNLRQKNRTYAKKTELFNWITLVVNSNKSIKKGWLIIDWFHLWNIYCTFDLFTDLYHIWLNNAS